MTPWFQNLKGSARHGVCSGHEAHPYGTGKTKGLAPLPVADILFVYDTSVNKECYRKIQSLRSKGCGWKYFCPLRMA